jgi:hypothetical protein
MDDKHFRKTAHLIDFPLLFYSFFSSTQTLWKQSECTNDFKFDCEINEPFFQMKNINPITGELNSCGVCSL